MKTCYTCKQSKDPADFVKDSRSKDGLRGDCRACQKSKSASYYSRNKDTICQKTSEWKATNREHVLAASAEYRKLNKEAINKVIAEWQVKNHDRVLKKSRDWYTANRERQANNVKAYRKNNPEWVALKASRSNAKKSGYTPMDSTVTELKQLRHTHSGVCDNPICSRPATSFYHDHVTGKVRGLLCHVCNTSIAVFGDSLEGLCVVAEYLCRTSP